MNGIERLVTKARQMKEQGLTEAEIEDELHLSAETVKWLLTRGVKAEKPPSDVYIGWRSIGVYSYRMKLVSDIFVDIALEESEKHDFTIDTVLGVATTGVPIATHIANLLECELVVYTPPLEDGEKGKVSSNFAGLDGKHVLLFDDVLGTGKTMAGAIETLEDQGATPVLIQVLVNKTPKDDVNGVPLRALIRTTVV